MTDPEKTAEILGLEQEEQALDVLSFGYPARARNLEARAAENWISRADRKQVVRRL